MKSQIRYNSITLLPIIAWVYVLILSVAPILVGVTQTLLTDSPKTNPLLGNLAPPPNPWPRMISFSVVCAIFLGTVGWFTMFIQTRTWFHARPKLLQIVVFGLLTSLVIVILWLEIRWVFLITLLSPYDGPLIGLPVTPGWVVTIGWIWTGSIIFFVAVYFSKQYTLPRQDNNQP